MRDLITICDVSKSTLKDPIQLLQKGSVNYLDFSPEGTMLISSSTDEPFKVWQFELEKRFYDGSQILQKNQNNQKIPLYAFDKKFDLKADNSTLVCSNIFSDKGVNLIQYFF